MKRKDDSEPRAILAILLSLGVYWMWQMWFLPPPPPSSGEEGVADVTPSVESTASAPAAVSSPTPISAVPESDLPVRTSSFSTETLAAEFTSEGGGLTEIEIKGHRGGYDVNPIWSHVIDRITGESDTWVPYGEEPGVAYALTEKGLLVSAGGGPFVAGRYAVSEEPLSATRTQADGLRVTKTFRELDESGLLEVLVRFENVGSASWQGPLWVGITEYIDGDASRYANSTQPMALVDGDLEVQDDMGDLEEDGPSIFEGDVGWLAISDRYFMAAAIPEVPSWGRLFFAKSGDSTGSFMVRDQTLEPGRVEEIRMKVYAGSKDLGLLEEVGYDLEKSVDFGFFGLFSGILLWILQFFHGLVGNWGFAIILLTLVVKASFWPLTRKSFQSSRAMQTLQPKLTELKEKYKDNPQKQGEEQMKLFKEEGVNPLSGCLPMIVQMPVWFALYSVLLYSADVYHAKFFYLQDLSSADPIGILPFLVGVFMMLQQRIMPMSPSMDPLQQKMMRMMPLIFVVFMFTFPSGLCLYILVNTILSITQMWLIHRANPLPEVPASTVAKTA